jgi:hypothetical protein
MYGKPMCSVSLVYVLALASWALAAGDPSLVIYYSFDEVGAVVRDQSGKGHDGVVRGGITADPHGMHNGAAGFAKGGYLDLDGPQFPVEDIPTSAMTLAAWVKCENTGDHHALFDARSDFNTWIVHPELRSDGQFRWMLRAYGMSAIFDIRAGSVTWGQWLHYAGTYDKESGRAVLYINGQVVSELELPPGTDIAGDWRNGARVGLNIAGARAFTGSMDDFYLFKRALPQSEIKKLMYGVGWPYASSPSPADGATYTNTKLWVNLRWTSGASAVSHTVYLSDDFDDVNDGSERAFCGTGTSAYKIAGLANTPYPTGLVPGTTYYWRIDEVGPDATYQGDVWSFWIPPNTAYDPRPADGTRFIDPNVVLNWTAGLRANLHTVYFGENFDDVNNASEGTSQPGTTHTPSTLELDKTYYWRVDESGPSGAYEGKVWSFTTAGPLGGLRADYHVGVDLENHVLRRTDPQINFNWGFSGPDDAVGTDSFSIRWTGEIYVPISGIYSFYPTVQGGVRLWVDDRLLIDEWRDFGVDERWKPSQEDQKPVEYHRAIHLEVGTHPIVMEFSYERSFGPAVASLSWGSPAIPKQVIPQAALSLPAKANRPSPYHEAVDIRHNAILGWSAGHYAASHQIYFGTDEEAVEHANTASPEYKGARPLGSESYDPVELAWDTTYYWRVDEIDSLNPESPWIGRVWSFTTADFVVVDDFEDYNNVSPNRVFQTWIDGGGFSPDQWFPQGHLGNGTGATLGHDIWTGGTPYRDIMEKEIVHGGTQSAPLYYDGMSEITRTFDAPQDWTEHDIEILSLWFYGDPANVVEQMYVKINGSPPIAYDGDAGAVTQAAWHLWNIDLARFGVDLGRVSELTIGLKPIGPTGGEGILLLDDIRLYHPPPPEALEVAGLVYKAF